MIKRWWCRLIVRRRKLEQEEKQKELDEAARRLRNLERFVAVKKAGR